MAHTIHVVSHTHWDREWYLTYQQFRIRLVELVDYLLEILESDEAFRYFNLDSQTIVLEDYLAVRPYQRELLERHIQEGRITVGPWYQLNDEFLTSGESTVRSLLVGHRVAESFGAVLKVGYLPDQFGNISQMPQILNGFGIDNAIVGRGYQLIGDRRMEFWWEAPDGSRVLASLMAFWYNNAQRIPPDPEDAVAYLEGLRDRMAPVAATGHLLAMNGVDHLAPQGDIGPVLQGAAELLKQRGSDISVQHVTLAHYVDAVCREVEERKPELAIKVGELREDRNGSCLAGTLSSRMYLKQRNDHSQTALTHVAERLSAFARTRGYIYPYDLMNLTWKLLMQNHPHDSICGCSIDAVHREMITRFDQVDQIADELTQRALDELCDRDQTLGVTGEEESLMVVNTLNWSRTDPVMAVLEFPLGMPARSGAECDLTRQVRGFALLDPDGQEVPFAVLKTERVLKNVLNPSELPLVQWVQRFEIEFVAEEIPGFGFKLFQVEPRDRMPQYPPMSTPADAADGVAARLCFQDTGDAGDEYLHRPPVRNGQVACPVFDGGAVHEERTAVRWSRTRSVVLPLPRESSAAARTTETVACPATVTLTRWRGVPRTEIDIEFENRACDHRLRIVWPVGRVDQVVADGAFDAVERSPRSPWEPEGGSPFQPQQWWVDATGERGDGGTGGITVINQGLPEYEMYESADGAHAVYDLGVTLLRCVGVLSGRGDGPGTATPEAQCLGRHAFRLAVVEHDDDWREARVWKQAHQFNVPFVPVHAAVPEDVPAVASYMVVEPDEAVVTAVKRAEDRDSLIVRFYNTSDAPVADACVMIPGASRVRFVNMNEEPLDEWVEGDALVFDLERKRIATVEFEL